MVAKSSIDEDHTKRHDQLVTLLDQFLVEFQRINVVAILQSKKPENENKRAQFNVVTSQFISAISTFNSILLLSNSISLRLKDALALSRVFYETCLNAAYTSLDDGNRAMEAELYPVFARFKSQTKVNNASGYFIKTENNSRINRSHPIVKKALKMFDGKGKLENTSIRESREKKIKEVSNNDSMSGLFFASIETLIFEISSEIIHGSYYGFDLFHNSEGTKDTKHLEAHFETILITVVFSALALARTLNKSLSPTRLTKKFEVLAFDIFGYLDPEEAGPIVSDIKSAMNKKYNPENSKP